MREIRAVVLHPYSAKHSMSRVVIVEEIRPFQFS